MKKPSLEFLCALIFVALLSLVWFWNHTREANQINEQAAAAAKGGLGGENVTPESWMKARLEPLRERLLKEAEKLDQELFDRRNRYQLLEAKAELEASRAKRKVDADELLPAVAKWEEKSKVEQRMLDDLRKEREQISLLTTNAFEKKMLLRSEVLEEASVIYKEAGRLFAMNAPHRVLMEFQEELQTGAVHKALFDEIEK